MSKRLYRANWALTGLKDRNLKKGDTIELTDKEAAPYVGDTTDLNAEEVASRFVLSLASESREEPTKPEPKKGAKPAGG